MRRLAVLVACCPTLCGKRHFPARNLRRWLSSQDWTAEAGGGLLVTYIVSERDKGPSSCMQDHRGVDLRLACAMCYGFVGTR